MHSLVCGLISWSSIQFIPPPVFMLMLSSFQYCNFIEELKISDIDASQISFLCGFLWLAGVFSLCDLEYRSFEVYEELCWDFEGDCIESIDCFLSTFYYVNTIYTRAWETYQLSDISSISLVKDLKFLS